MSVARKKDKRSRTSELWNNYDIWGCGTYMAEVSENAGGFVLDVFARDPQSEGRGAPVVLELKLATAKEIVEAMTRAIEYEEEQWVRKENRDFRDLLAGIINHYEVEGHKTIFAEFGSPNVYV